MFCAASLCYTMAIDDLLTLLCHTRVHCTRLLIIWIPDIPSLHHSFPCGDLRLEERDDEEMQPHTAATVICNQVHEGTSLRLFLQSAFPRVPLSGSLHDHDHDDDGDGDGDDDDDDDDDHDEDEEDDDDEDEGEDEDDNGGDDDEDEDDEDDDDGDDDDGDGDEDGDEDDDDDDDDGGGDCDDEDDGNGDDDDDDGDYDDG